MLSQLQIGPLATTTSLSDGNQANLRGGKLGDLIVSELCGRYYEANYRRALFNGASQAATVTTVALATTYTGLCLSNPVGSSVNIQLISAGYAFPVAPAATVVVGLMVGYNSGTNVTHTTPVTPKSSFVGVGTSPVGLLDAAATFPTAPWVERILGKVDTGAITVDTMSGGSQVDIGGSIILPPGSYAAFYTSTASAASGFFGSFQWIETPV